MGSDDVRNFSLSLSLDRNKLAIIKALSERERENCKGQALKICKSKVHWILKTLGPFSFQEKGPIKVEELLSAAMK